MKKIKPGSSEDLWEKALYILLAPPTVLIIIIVLLYKAIREAME